MELVLARVRLRSVTHTCTSLKLRQSEGSRTCVRMCVCVCLYVGGYQMSPQGHQIYSFNYLKHLKRAKMWFCLVFMVRFRCRYIVIEGERKSVRERERFVWALDVNVLIWARWCTVIQYIWVPLNNKFSSPNWLSQKLFDKFDFHNVSIFIRTGYNK